MADSLFPNRAGNGCLSPRAQIARAPLYAAPKRLAAQIPCAGSEPVRSDNRLPRAVHTIEAGSHAYLAARTFALHERALAPRLGSFARGVGVVFASDAVRPQLLGVSRERSRGGAHPPSAPAGYSCGSESLAQLCYGACARYRFFRLRSVVLALGVTSAKPRLSIRSTARGRIARRALLRFRDPAPIALP